MAAPRNSDPIVGIDLGTTNSLVAICDERGPRIIPDAHGRALLPSVVRLEASRVVVGRDARDHAVEHPTRTISSVKRLMGRGIDDAQRDLPHLSYELIAGPPGAQHAARIKVDDRIFSPEELSAMILGALRQQAQDALGTPVHRAVITVPAYFDDAQRQATRDAARLAGLEVMRIVNEPTAAALAYGLGQLNSEPQTIAVYDLGGGTFDISILRVTPPSPDSAGTSESFFEVLATAGDTHLGGDDVDHLIMQLALDDITRELGPAPRSPGLAGDNDATGQKALSPSARQALRQLAEATKIALSAEQSAQMRLNLGDGQVLERTLTREDLERLAEPWVERSMDCCARAMRDANLAPDDIDRIVLVGGATRMPIVRRRVGEFFGREPYTALDPDQVVAMGAAVQGAILAGTHRGALLLDVIPLSLGIETVGGAVAKLIMRNSHVPARATEMFSTSVDGQTSIKIHVLQGERELVADCRSLAEFHLRDVPPMPAGIPQIEVEFLVDANGILNVSAGERRSGKRASVQVVPRYGLSPDEVARMEQDSITHARQDMHAHRIIDLAVNAQLDIKWTRDAMARVGDELPAEDRQRLNTHITALEQMIEQARLSKGGSDAGGARGAGPGPSELDADAFHRAKEELDRSAMRLHELAITASLRSQ